MTVGNSESIIDGFQYRHNRIGCTRRCSNQLVIRFDRVRVHSGDDVFHLALSRGRQQYLAHTFTGQVPSEPINVTPCASTVDNECILNPVHRVVDGARIGGINKANGVPITNDGLMFRVYTDGASERAMNRITPHQAGTFVQIFDGIFRWPENHSPGNEVLATPRFFDQQPHDQTANSTESIDHNVARWMTDRRFSAQKISAGCFHIILERLSLGICHKRAG